MILLGKNLIIKSNGTAIAAAKSCTIEVQADDIEVATPGTSKWKTFIAGRMSWKVDVSGLIVDTQTAPVADIVAKLRMPGNIVEMTCSVWPDENMYPGILPFAGWINVDPADIEQVGLTSWPDVIYFNGPEGNFIGKKDDKWYVSWARGTAYTLPEEGAFFHDLEEDIVYQWQNDYLEGYAQMTVFTGNALCNSCRATGSIGNLSTFSASFLGTGMPNGIGTETVPAPQHAHGQMQVLPGQILAADGNVVLTQTGEEVQALLNKMASLELATEADIEAAFGGE